MCCSHVNRRGFLSAATGALAANAWLPASALAAAKAPAWDRSRWDPDQPLQQPGRPLRVQPILMYQLPTRKHATSWKSWGGVQTAPAAAEEAARIQTELSALASRTEFRMEVLPVAHATSPEEAAKARGSAADVTIVYPATGSGTLLRACVGERGDALIFVRHRSGPVYYWYEALSGRYLRTHGAAASAGGPRLSVDNVVVDDPAELHWRLRALYGVKNLLGTRIVALGGVWGKYAEEAPQVARERFRMEILETSYDDLDQRIRAAFASPAAMARAEEWTRRYLSLPGTTLDTERPFVVNSFLLYGVFKDLLAEHNATAFTIRQCMGTIMPMAKTTACLTLGLLNDEGLLAFCESDFVIIPAGVLLRHIAAKPVFLHNSTFPHSAVVTCAHCTGPRRMDGVRYEPTRIVTHYESEYGAAPKVEIPIGQEVTFINPEYATGRWVGMKGIVEANPFYEICRSQQDVRILGNWKKLIHEVRDSHWVMVYGDYLRDAGYAAERLGLRWDPLIES